MNKCFITKLPSSVDNDNLPVLGQLRINWSKQSDLADNDARAISLATNDSIVVKVSGAHLTDNTLSSNLGNTKTITAADGIVWLYVSNDADAVLTIDNKYALTTLNFVAQGSGKENLKRSVKFDINDIRYCTALANLYLANTQVSGDLSAVSQLTSLTWLGLANTQVSGDLSAVSQLTSLTWLNLSNTQVSGDISAVSQLTGLSHFNLANTQVSGDISALSQLTSLTSFKLDKAQVSGKIDSLANLTKLFNLANLKGLSLTGDMSKIPANVRFISLLDRKVTTNFTWTAKGRQNATLLAIEGAPFDTASMDNMLIDQATCTVSPSATYSFEKTIQVSGIRTSASDEAVAAIQSKGITITGVIKA